MAVKVSTLVFFCHLSALLGFIVPGANVVAPLWIWMVHKNRSVLIDAQGLESLNFQVSMTVLFVFSWFFREIHIGKGLMLLLAVVDFVFIVVAVFNVLAHGSYRYPFNFRLVK
jgi:hypothetical protein